MAPYRTKTSHAGEIGSKSSPGLKTLKSTAVLSPLTLGKSPPASSTISQMLLYSRRLNFVLHCAFLLFSVFSIVPRIFVILLVSPVIFSYVTFDIFVSIFSCIVSVVWYSFFYRRFLVAIVIMFQSS